MLAILQDGSSVEVDGRLCSVARGAKTCGWACSSPLAPSLRGASRGLWFPPRPSRGFALIWCSGGARSAGTGRPERPSDQCRARLHPRTWPCSGRESVPPGPSDQRAPTCISEKSVQRFREPCGSNPATAQSARSARTCRNARSRRACPPQPAPRAPHAAAAGSPRWRRTTDPFPGPGNPRGGARAPEREKSMPGPPSGGRELPSWAALPSPFLLPHRVPRTPLFPSGSAQVERGTGGGDPAGTARLPPACPKGRPGPELRLPGAPARGGRGAARER